MPDKVPVSIGQILILREEFVEVTTCPDAPMRSRERAACIIQLLNELIDRREAEVTQ